MVTKYSSVLFAEEIRSGDNEKWIVEGHASIRSPINQYYISIKSYI